MIEPSDDAEERLFQRAKLAFDEEDAALGPDAVAADRVLARLLAEPSPLARRRRLRPIVLLAAAAVLVVSVASAVVGVLRSRESAPPHASPVASLAPSAARVIAPPLEPVAPSASPAVSSAPSAAGSDASPALIEPPQSAAELLSAAGQARRQGQNGRALRLLERLQTRYPTSPEAQASDITMGMLRLQGGSPGVALSAFDRYLLRTPSGPRAPDALWGRAQALSALGRQGEAKKSLELLLGRYPNSPYTSAAQAKLRGAAP